MQLARPVHGLRQPLEFQGEVRDIRATGPMMISAMFLEIHFMSLLALFCHPGMSAVRSILGVKRKWRGHRQSDANDPGRVKTRSVMLVCGVGGDAGGIVQFGAANSAESICADA